MFRFSFRSNCNSRPIKSIFVTGSFVEWKEHFELYEQLEDQTWSASIPISCNSFEFKFIVDYQDGQREWLCNENDYETCYDCSGNKNNKATLPPPVFSEGTKLEEEKISDSVFEVTSIDDKSVKSEVNAVEEEVFKNSSTNQENEKRISDEEISKDETKDERKEQEQSFYQKNELDKEEEIRRKCESNEQFEPENFKEDEEEGNHHDDMGNGSIENKADISPNFEISNKQFENKIPQSIQLCESGKETEFSPTPSEELSKRIAMKYNYTVKEDEFDSPFYPRKTDKIRSWLEEEYENQEKDYSGISLGKTFFSNFGMASFHTIL